MNAAPVPPDGENPLRVDVRPADDRYFVWVCPTHGIISEDELAEGVDWQNPNPDGDIYTDEFFCQREHGEGEDHRAESYDLAPAFAAGRAAATPDPQDDDKRVRVTCFDPVTGESETQPLDPDNYILTLGARCEITACQVYANGTVQLTIKRGAA